MARRRMLWTLIYGAGAAVLAAAPAFSAASVKRRGAVQATLCAEGGRRIVEIDIGGDEPQERSRHSPCHAVCLPGRKSTKSQGTR